MYLKSCWASLRVTKQWWDAFAECAQNCGDMTWAEQLECSKLRRDNKCDSKLILGPAETLIKFPAQRKHWGDIFFFLPVSNVWIH